MKFDKLVDGILSANFVVEQTGKTIVIFPGGFHPFHIGHKSVFDNIKNQFPNADTYIAITDYTAERPFTAQEKKMIISSTGIDPNKIAVVKSPFKSEEILKNYNPKADKVIFAVSEKERTDPKKAGLFTRTKKDGTPSYFQDYTGGEMMPFEKNGYIYVFPTEEFNIGGKKFKSASQLREYYKTLKELSKIDFLKNLYIKNLDKIKALFDKKLTGSAEENEMSVFIDKERLKDENEKLGGDGIFLNPPYQTDNRLTVGRMKY
jgi:cytidyltransferase-like protein